MTVESGASLAIEQRVERVTTPSYPQRVAALLIVAAMVGLASSFDATLAAEEPSGEGLIQRIVRHATRPGVAVRAIRELRAGTRSGKHLGWMAVETIITPSGTLSWKVIEEGGSERTRNNVFRELLQAEAQSSPSDARDAALIPANYDFQSIARSSNGETRIRLKPRRADTRLVDGILTVSGEGYPLRLEGTLAKSPSFWVKSVTVVKRYGRFAGIALPTDVESFADLRMFGQASFTMRYRYSEVNGQSVRDAVASARSLGPSAEILAIHEGRN